MGSSSAGSARYLQLDESYMHDEPSLHLSRSAVGTRTSRRIRLSEIDGSDYCSRTEAIQEHPRWSLRVEYVVLFDEAGCRIPRLLTCQRLHIRAVSIQSVAIEFAATSIIVQSNLRWIEVQMMKLALSPVESSTAHGAVSFQTGLTVLGHNSKRH